MLARNGAGTNKKYDLDWRVRLAVRSDPPKGGSLNPKLWK
jgi:hypothetical protein